MHFSTLAISMLATSAAAYRRVHVKQEAVVVTEYVTHVVTEGAVQAKQTWAPVEDNNDWAPPPPPPPPPPVPALALAPAP
ncbi:hypothetical protein NM208_g8513 [Fusarium decemcellulare]|uniref:Uncharacterized protein n=1 Tax=Fusarium decemcellulare TaxID=57161 RepID=A0ACC1S5B4_9HYPO|nr:hypothetical protein NM208_g8513 [Fusarium decemcellulare]